MGIKKGVFADWEECVFTSFKHPEVGVFAMVADDGIADGFGLFFCKSLRIQRLWNEPNPDSNS